MKLFPLTPQVLERRLDDPWFQTNMKTVNTATTLAATTLARTAAYDDVVVAAAAAGGTALLAGAYTRPLFSST
jgi:hypothetical protein